MKAESIKSVAIKKDEFGNVIEVLEIKTMSVSEIKKLEQQAQERKCKLAEIESEKLKLEEKKEQEQERKDLIGTYVLAKCQFNELVDSGKTETTKEFEEMYDKFVNGASFDESIMPNKYREILGRLR